MGLGARAIIEEGLRRAGAHDDIDQMVTEFLVHYEANIAAEESPLFLAPLPHLRHLLGRREASPLHQQAREPRPKAHSGAEP